MLFQDVEGFQRHPRCLQVCDFFLLFFLVSNSTKTPRKGFYVQLPRFDVVALRVRLHPIEFHSIWKWRAGEICFSTETTFPHITFTFQLRSKLDIQQFHVLETVRRVPSEHFFAPFFLRHLWQTGEMWYYLHQQNVLCLEAFFLRQLWQTARSPLQTWCRHS